MEGRIRIPYRGGHREEKLMDLLIGTMCFGAIIFYGYCMAKYLDAKAEHKAKMYKMMQKNIKKGF